MCLSGVIHKIVEYTVEYTFPFRSVEVLQIQLLILKYVLVYFISNSTWMLHDFEIEYIRYGCH